mmetsp:Transcript_17276/g.28155  ORF Transcript_17276/g.28155 Transcript_17276/m.28155 type:complete len:279 (+) Transcript_17276:172-1008(+)
MSLSPLLAVDDGKTQSACSEMACLELAFPLTTARNLSLQPLQTHGLRAFQWQRKRSVPDNLREDAEGAADGKEHGVELDLADAVVPEQHPAVRVHVGPGVLGLAVLRQHSGHHVVDGAHNGEKLVVLGQVLEGELALAGVAGVRLPEDGVPEAGDHLARVQRVPGKLCDRLLVHLEAFLLELLLQVERPAQHLLVGQAVQRARQRVEPGRVGQVGVGQRAAHQVRGVRRGVAALVVRVDRQVQPHQLVDRGVVVPEHAAKVGRVVQGGVGLTDHTIVE